jgi:hypothetical protein
MAPTQPPDEWEFLSRDEELESPEPEEIAPEAMAEFVEKHMIAPEEILDALDASLDTGQAMGGERDEPPVIPFPDEEPDWPAGRDPAASPAEDVEPDLEEILESQHYAFEAEEDT